MVENRVPSPSETVVVGRRFGSPEMKEKDEILVSNL